MILKTLLFLSIFYPSVLSKVDYDPKKSKCSHCKTFVQKFHNKMYDSSNKNFGGGDTSWEEKRGITYENSETRLLEALEEVCGKDFGCAQIIEDSESEIEEYFFTISAKSKESKKKRDSMYNDEQIYDSPLFNFLCLEKNKFCCQNNYTYGPKCVKCPGVNNLNQVCNNFGTCTGAGDRKGSGKCKCDSGYSGKACEKCKPGYFKNEKNDGKCQKCDKSCYNNCDGPNDSDCLGDDKGENRCKKGYVLEEERCIDINECQNEKSVCPTNQFCQNTSGSYNCNNCSDGCDGCFKKGSAFCKGCKEGYVKEINKDYVNTNSKDIEKAYHCKKEIQENKDEESSKTDVPDDLNYENDDLIAAGNQKKDEL